MCVRIDGAAYVVAPWPLDEEALGDGNERVGVGVDTQGG